MTRFPDAPKDAEYSPEGWLLVGDEAWTEHDWALLSKQQRRQVTNDAPTVDETPEEEYRRIQRMRARERARQRRAVA